MNLLLLLSAMLSALSGAGLSARAPQAPVAVNAMTATVAATRVTPAATVGRPLQVLPRPADAVPGAALNDWQLAPSAPLYLSRRRE